MLNETKETLKGTEIKFGSTSMGTAPLSEV